MIAHLTLFFLGIIGVANADLVSLGPDGIIDQTETCADMIQKYQFHGTCCSLQDDLSTGNCVITVKGGTDSYCYWRDPCDSGCTPNCPTGPHSCVTPYTQYQSTSSEECPSSTYDVLNREQPCCSEICPAFASDERFCPVNPGGSGDPHFKTWHGEKYDFHGSCDLVLLQNPHFMNNTGIDIHIRTKFTGAFSYISTAALRIGEDTLEVMGGLHEDRYWINKVPGEKINEAILFSETIGGFPIHFRQVHSNQREFVVDLGNGEAVNLKTWKDFVRVDIINGSGKNFGESLGLMGAYHSGLKMSRDNMTIMEEVNDFGLEWQVLPGEPKLFHKVEGVQAPEKCALPDTNKARRRLGETAVSREDAEIACSHVNLEDQDFCIFDVLAVNDVDVANSYWSE